MPGLTDKVNSVSNKFNNIKDTASTVMGNAGTKAKDFFSMAGSKLGGLMKGGKDLMIKFLSPVVKLAMNSGPKGILIGLGLLLAGPFIWKGIKKVVDVVKNLF